MNLKVLLIFILTLGALIFTFSIDDIMINKLMLTLSLVGLITTYRFSSHP